MPLEPFVNHFEEVAKRETRTLTILEPHPGGIPPGEYALIEWYCTEPGCNCRRVLLQAFNARQGSVASISFGFDRKGPMAGPFVDPLNRRTPYAEALLALVDKLCLHDAEYVARLERHYRMVREKVDAPQRERRWVPELKTKKRKKRY